jgi:hypothetical protein
LANSLTYTMRQLLLISLLLFPVITLADNNSAWCIIRDQGENCRFNTAEACYNVAATQGGFCRQNPRILGMSGESQWCVVSASGRDCTFSGRGRCLDKARAINAGCVENTDAALRIKRQSQGFEWESAKGEDISLTEELEASLRERSDSATND